MEQIYWVSFHIFAGLLALSLWIYQSSKDITKALNEIRDALKEGS